VEPEGDTNIEHERDRNKGLRDEAHEKWGAIVGLS
jgi:hypothetical protein